MPVIRDEVVRAYRARARQGAEVVESIRRRGIGTDRNSPLFNPDFVDQLNGELVLDADAMSRSDLYWVSAPMSALAAEYSDSDAPWRPNVEAPSEYGMLCFADTPMTVVPLPPHGVPTVDGREMFASWTPELRLTDIDLPRVPLAGFRWALRGDSIDISFYIRREQMREVFTEYDAAGKFLQPRELVDKNWWEKNRRPELDFLPRTVPWMSTYSLDSETSLIEWERIVLSATEDFSIVETERMKLAGADPTNGLWLAGTIVPSVWTMMKSEKVAKTRRDRITRKVKSLGGSRVETLNDDVSIIDVRPYEFKPHTQTGTGRKISVRFMVRGHFTTTWTGKGRTIPKRNFIMPYWKGTPEMPIKTGERVNVIR